MEQLLEILSINYIYLFLLFENHGVMCYIDVNKLITINED